MKTYILMTRLAPDVAAKMKDRAEIGAAWLDEVHEKCPDVKFLAHYALLGTYDFMDIYEARDEETAAKVSLISRAHGAAVAESWTAIPYKRLLALTKEI
ncbi:MAG: GYD domain-containing protein [Candidatus Zixiibacteriota bacterium]